MGSSTTALGCLIYMGKGEASISYCLSLALSFTDNPEAQILCPKKEFKNLRVLQQQMEPLGEGCITFLQTWVPLESSNSVSCPLHPTSVC